MSPGPNAIGFVPRAMSHPGCSVAPICPATDSAIDSPTDPLQPPFLRRQRQCSREHVQLLRASPPAFACFIAPDIAGTGSAFGVYGVAIALVVNGLPEAERRKTIRWSRNGCMTRRVENQWSTRAITASRLHEIGREIGARSFATEADGGRRRGTGKVSGPWRGGWEPSAGVRQVWQRCCARWATCLSVRSATRWKPGEGDGPTFDPRTPS